ncbi:hypothetical protein Pryu01_03140 [Paraliobacillus ryukyuensis]|uniref:Uncharacterized protein n=2 Tax=Paraliobacillus ryukyuensis TaxID=200904 RepID=A0A366DLN9_9BACI|nr:hypothetical protein [Paraliobacillus ryukyuensis]RBO90997.1 hypothetical protein DES48_1258 [Paraliobacillus ryukyuensis]
MKQIKEHIPHCYTWLANGNKALFKRYVASYIERNVPGYKLLRVEDKGTVAVCIKK